MESAEIMAILIIFAHWYLVLVIIALGNNNFDYHYYYIATDICVTISSE